MTPPGRDAHAPRSHAPAMTAAAGESPPAIPTIGPRLVSLWPIFALAALIIVTFSPVFDAQFVRWDDYSLVQANSYFNPVNARTFHHFWREPHAGLYTPLAYTLWSLIAIFRPPHAAPIQAAAAFHALNVGIHIAATAFTYLLLLCLTRQKLSSFVAAAVFALHPLQVEPVAWVSGMNNLLAGLFAIVSLVAYLRHAQAQSRQTATLWYAAAIGSLVLALLAKPTAVVVPLLAAAIDLLLVVRSFRRVARSVAPLLLIAAAFAIVARLVQPAVSVRAPSPLFRVVVALDALAFYFAKLVWPVGMNIDYGRTPQWLSEQTIRYCSWTVPAAAFAISWIGRRRWPGIFAGLAIFVISLIPVLGLVPFDFQQYSTVADRYAYLGVLGVSISLAGILSRINRRGVLAFVGVALTLVLGVLSFLRAGDWHDSRILFARTFDLNPQSLMANRSIAAQLIDDGRPREAEIFAQRSVDFHPGSAEALMNLAAVYMARGELSRAAEQYQKVLAINPDDGGAHYSLAAALAQSGQLDAALVHARRSVELNPLDDQAHLNLGTILAETGQTDAAIEQFETAVRISPDDPRAHANLGQMLLERGLRDEAIAHFEAALRADPRFAPAAEGLRRARAPATMP